jgi:hypothetical protein
MKKKIVLLMILLACGGASAKIDFFVAPRFLLDITHGAWGGDVEFGMVGGNNLFFSLALGYSVFDVDRPNRSAPRLMWEDPETRSQNAPEGNYTSDSDNGFGLNIGGQVFDFPEAELRLSAGAFVGLWGASDKRKVKRTVVDAWNLTYEEDRITFYHGFLGPIVKLRWRFAELSYRGMAGIVQEWDGTFTTSRYGSTIEYSKDFGIGYTNQLMLGVYFQTSRNARQARKQQAAPSGD